MLTKKLLLPDFKRWCHKMKLSFFHEPELEFGNGGTHVDIRHGVTRHGPLDVDDSASPTHLRVGLVGTEETIIDLRQ